MTEFANKIKSELVTRKIITNKLEVEKTSIVKSEKTVLVASTDNSVSLPMFAKLSSDIEENKNTPTMEEIKTNKEIYNKKIKDIFGKGILNGIRE